MLVGCGTTSPDPFLIDVADCSLVNNYTIGGQPSQWNDCRVYWSGAPSNILSVELTISGTSGSFLEPDTRWMRASIEVPDGSVSDTRRTLPYNPLNMLPTDIADGRLMLGLRFVPCGEFGERQISVPVTAEAGDRSASFAMTLPDETCSTSGAQAKVGGGFIVTASSSAMGSVDPASVVGPLP